MLKTKLKAFFVERKFNEIGVILVLGGILIVIEGYMWWNRKTGGKVKSLKKKKGKKGKKD